MIAQQGQSPAMTPTVRESRSGSSGSDIAAGADDCELGHQSSEENRTGSHLKRVDSEMTPRRAELPLRGI